MYRQLNLKCLTQTKHKLLTSRLKVIGINSSPEYQKLSHLCNTQSTKTILIEGPFNFFKCIKFLKRVHSTIPSTELLQTTLKKKRKRKNNKFTELLQVTDSATTETKTSILKLKAQRLSDFIDESSLCEAKSKSMSVFNAHDFNILLEEEMDPVKEEIPLVFVKNNVNQINLPRNKLEETMESYQMLKEIHEEHSVLSENPKHLEEHINTLNGENLECLELEGDTEIPIHDELLKSINSTVKIADTYKSKYHKTVENELLARQKSSDMSLEAYVNVCISSGMINRGFATVINYRRKQNKKDSSWIGIRVYNELLHAYAAKENFNKITEILNILDRDKIPYTPQTFAAIFECLGRLPLTDGTIENIRKFHIEAIKRGITYNEIMDKSQFLFDQHETILRVIKLVEPNFIPLYTAPAHNYANPLLNKLNENVLSYDHKQPESCDYVGSNNMIDKTRFDKNLLDNLRKEQVRHELGGYVTVKSIKKHPQPDQTVLYYRRKLAELKQTWNKQICASFKRELGIIKFRIESNHSINIFPYLKALNVEQFAEVLMSEIHMLVEGSESYSPTVGQLYRALGQKVQTRYHMQQKQLNGILDKTCLIHSLYSEEKCKLNSSDNPRQLWQRLVHQNKNQGPNLEINFKAWPASATLGVGKFLYNILIRDLKVDANILRPNNKTQNLLPACYTLFRHQGRSIREDVKVHPVLTKLFQGSQPETLTFNVNLVPMLCPPQPWSTPVNGGYLLAKTELIRLPLQAHQQWDRINEFPPENIYPALDSLNQLSSIPWKVNTEVLDVILNVFENGGSDKLDVPKPPSSIEPITPPAPGVLLSNRDKFKLYKEKLSQQKAKQELYSLWCDALYRLSLANHFRDKAFWLPHNMDFRGRVYPAPPHLNHIGSDLARCLLLFHQSKPLGEGGYNWLKLHCINLTGFKKKSSLEDRIAYAEEMMDDILDSADNPLAGRMWWAKSDKPWQTLTCCMEIAKVSRCADPTKFLSCFPIHQDGSCNGLQHYAALGRDTAGAISVNLAPSKVPQDVYNAVALMVEEIRQNDAKNNVKIAQILKGFVSRKVVKQTVMTTVYGVTKFGARLQIAKQLRDIEAFPKDYVWSASLYLTSKTFDSLMEMFTSTKEIQEWLTECARKISTVCSKNVEWVTPLGLPIVQPYNYYNHHTAKLKTNKLSEHFQMDSYEKPNILKQKNAFPPNFIHSLDSSHMMLTSLHCERAGLTFISVHDCFWTHACSVPEMNKICREQFVALHSQPILENLSKYLLQRYRFDEKMLINDGSVTDASRKQLNKTLLATPRRADFELKNVLESVFFFS